MAQKVNVISCNRRVDGKYFVIIAETCGGRNKRQIVTDTPVATDSDIWVEGDKMVERPR